MEAPRTKDAMKLLAALGVTGSATLIPAQYNTNLYLASRNIPGIEVRPVAELSAYDVLRPKVVVMEQAALQTLMGQKS